MSTVRNGKCKSGVNMCVCVCVFVCACVCVCLLVFHTAQVVMSPIVPVRVFLCLQDLSLFPSYLMIVLGMLGSCGDDFG